MSAPSHYFDYAATAPPFEEALAEQARVARQAFGNPSSTHAFGRRAAAELRRLRDTFTARCGFDGRLVVTSGATEANNLAIHGFLRAHPDARVAVAVDVHASVWETCGRYGERMDTVPVDGDGVLSPAVLAAALRPETGLFCCSHASNETGMIHDVAALAALCDRRGVRCLVDGSQALGHTAVDLSAIGCDVYTFSAHKFGGPRGVGGALVRGGLGEALMDGGHQQWGMRPGTENLPGLAGTVEALRLSTGALAAEMRRLRALAARIVAAAPAGAVVNGDPARGLPGFVSLSFPGRSGQELVAELELKGLAVATGSACQADVVSPSRVILALGRAPEVALGTLRISCGRLTTAEAVDALAKALGGWTPAHGGEV